ncbi:hypothetical protein [Endozoicomonas sp. YOMI1]|uniref:hypothetical protein n=1 Tax=Endozoicomonas sp. YOMI1 TaxID=2828739 RepID=UPI002148A1A7|nr:hypothetical protein [Endozoicomonas sp. YOMI1]
MISATALTQMKAPQESQLLVGPDSSSQRGCFGPREVSQIPREEVEAHQLPQSVTEFTLQIDTDSELSAGSALPKHLSVADLIRQQVKLELVNSPICPVFLVSDPYVTDLVRLCQSVKEKMHEYGLSQEDIDNALGLMSWKAKFTRGKERVFFVRNRNANDCLYALKQRDQIHIENVFESFRYDEEDEGKWTPVAFECFKIPKPLMKHRYVKPAYFNYSPYLKIKKEKYISDRVTQILTGTHDIFHNIVLSKMSDSEKVAHLGNILCPTPSTDPAEKAEKASGVSSPESEKDVLSAPSILARIGQAGSLNSKDQSSGSQSGNIVHEENYLVTGYNLEQAIRQSPYHSDVP